MTHTLPPGAAARRLALVLALAAAGPLAAQSTLETTPNLKGTWMPRTGTASFVFAHRFVSLHSGDEVFNLPTFTLAAGLPGGFAVGLEHTTNSETVASRLGANETEYWVKKAFPLGRTLAVAGVAAYNTVARSADGAVTARVGAGPVTLLGEARGYSNLFHTDERGFSGTAGAVLHVNRFLGLTGDMGRVLSADSFGTIWSAGVAFAIPGSPHSVSIYAANNSVGTLQGAVHPRSIFPDKVRYGFTFVVPLGGPRRWMQIFNPPPAAQVDSGAAAPAGHGAHAPPSAAAGPSTAGADGVAAVPIKDSDFTVKEVHLRPGQSLRWTNLDEDVHTVTANDGSWSSPDLRRGESYVRRFDAPGRYPYYCQQHPDMSGLVVVE
jgi:plastocyanin